MVRSRFEHLVGLFSVIALGGGCEDPVEDGLDRSVFEDSLCDGDRFAVLEGLRPVEPVDHMQIRDAFLDEAGEGGDEPLAVLGLPCGAASDKDRCRADFEALPKESEFNTTESADTRRHRSLVFTRGDEVGRVASRTELRSFLGEIDAPHDAVLVAMMEFHGLVCDGTNNAAQTEDGWLLLTNTFGGACEHSEYHNVVSVARGGDMQILDTEIAVEDLSCAGRILRPDPTRGRFDRPARARAP